MVIVKIQSGLGNQLFQYAFGKHLSILNKTPLKLDVSYFSSQAEPDLNRKMGLEHFNIQASIASRYEIAQVKHASVLQRWGIVNKNYYIKQLGFGDSVTNYPAHPHYIVKPGFFSYDTDIVKVYKSHIYLDGFWQAFNYVEPVKDILSKELAFKHPLKTEQAGVMQQIRESQSVAIHIRRTDYINTTYGSNYYISLSLEYYTQAIEIIRSKMDDPVFFVFSDDITWCKNHLNLHVPVTFVENSVDDIEDLKLMSACKHQITANSSFSWWGAWLNGNRDKIVVAPEKWFKLPKAGTEDLLPEDWIKV